MLCMWEREKKGEKNCIHNDKRLFIIHHSLRIFRPTDLAAQRRGCRDHPPPAPEAASAAAATVVWHRIGRSEMRAGVERGEVRQRRG